MGRPGAHPPLTPERGAPPVELMNKKLYHRNKKNSVEILNIFSILKTKTNKYSPKGLHHSVQRFRDGKITKAIENSEPGNFLTETQIC